MKILTTVELAKKLAGGDSYIRTKNKEVKGLAIRQDKNPNAPEVIVVGTGARIIANAKLFLQQQKYVPVYVKQSVNAWKYVGDYRAESYSRDHEVIEKHRKHRLGESVDGILFLSSRDSQNADLFLPSVPDVKKRKKVELAAIKFVTDHYAKLGYEVTDHQSDNRGYDLLITKQREVLKVEVKGTSSSEQRFFISRNERSKSADPLWHLALVSNALASPTLEVFNTSQLESRFNFDEMGWECTAIQH